MSARQTAKRSTLFDRRGVLVGERRQGVSYLGHIGFFEYVGIEFGNSPGEALGSSNYLPLTIVRREELETEAAGRILQDAVLAKSARLAKMIFADESQQDILSYCLREIIRNVFEHAETNACTVMAQKYAGDQVEIAITDNGIGVQASLGQSYVDRAPIEALRDAIKPGVSGSTLRDTDERWDNTGFGLYIISRLGRETGTFSLASSGALLTLSGIGEHSGPAPIHGTAIRLLVSVSEAEYFPNRLHSIVAEGEEQLAADQQQRRSASKTARLSGERS